MYDDVVEEHRAHLRRLGRRPEAIKQRCWALQRFERWLERDILTATLDDLRRFTGREGRGSAAIATEVSHLRQFYRWALIEDLIERDPTIRLERPSVPRGHPRPMPDHNVAYALNHAPGRIRWAVALAAYAGLRACEIAPLRREDFGAQWIHIAVQKGGHPGRARIGPQLRRTIDEFPARGLLFPRLRHHGRRKAISANHLDRVVNGWLHDNGIDQTLHTLRHWYGTNLRRAASRTPGLDGLLVAQRGLRHRSIQSTVIYTETDDDELGCAADLLPDLGEAA